MRKDVDPNAPWILWLNPLFKKFGWTVWWEYEYVGSRLTKSQTHWFRNSKVPR